MLHIRVYTADMDEPCTDCPHLCRSRGTHSFCGLDRPGRVLWHGVTYAEEHEISPTYEIFLTGCSLRCRFCFVPETLYQPRSYPWLDPEELLRTLRSPTTAPFRVLSFVGGDPTVNLPWLQEIVPLLRRDFPSLPLVLNTNLFSSPHLSEWYSHTFDWIVGDFHFWDPACARSIGGASNYPDIARQNLSRMLAAGAKTILRLLVLPGHLECCVAPTVAWLGTLSGDLTVNVMTHYAPAGRARGDPQLGRHLNEDERRRSSQLISESFRIPRSQPLPHLGPRSTQVQDPAGHMEVDGSGNILIPFVTGDLLPLAAELSPGLSNRLSQVEAEPPLTRPHGREQDHLAES